MASSLASVIALSTRADCARSVASGFSISIGTPRSTVASTGSTWRCSSVAMMQAVTSGRAKSSRWLVVMKSAPMRAPTSPPRLWLSSAMPIHSTAGWRAATSPRNRPTRPAPMMASPMPLADFFMATPPRHCERSEAIQSAGTELDCFVASLLAMTKSSRQSYIQPRAILLLELGDAGNCFVGQRQIDRLVAIGREVRRAVSLHHAPRALRRHHDRGVADAGFEEVYRLRPGAAGIDVIDKFAGHGRHRKFLPMRDGVEPVVALGVVEEQRALGARD